MPLYRPHILRQHKHDTFSIKERNRLNGEATSVAIPIKILKDSGESCKTCAHLKPAGLMLRCALKSKIVKSYNICVGHSK